MMFDGLQGKVWLDGELMLEKTKGHFGFSAGIIQNALCESLVMKKSKIMQ